MALEGCCNWCCNKIKEKCNQNPRCNQTSPTQRIATLRKSRRRMPRFCISVNDILFTQHTANRSAAYFINAHCKDYNDDFMLCKRDSMDPAVCAAQGRKVSRCVLDLMKQMQTHCDKTFNAHWQCLEQGNNYYWKCRPEEQALTQCVFKKMVIYAYLEILCLTSCRDSRRLCRSLQTTKFRSTCAQTTIGTISKSL